MSCMFLMVKGLVAHVPALGPLELTMLYGPAMIEQGVGILEMRNSVIVRPSYLRNA